MSNNHQNTKDSLATYLKFFVVLLTYTIDNQYRLLYLIGSPMKPTESKLSEFNRWLSTITNYKVGKHLPPPGTHPYIVLCV